MISNIKTKFRTVMPRICDADHIGRIHQQLEVRIDQHILAKIKKGQCNSFYNYVNISGSVITAYLLNSHKCVLSCTKDNICCS